MNVCIYARASRKCHKDVCRKTLALTPNPALNLAPFSRWTLRDKTAQRRLALR